MRVIATSIKHIYLYTYVVPFVTPLENFRWTLFVTFDRRFKVESRRIRRRHRRRRHSLLVRLCWLRSFFGNLIPETEGREDLGARSTVYRYHVSLSFFLSFLVSIYIHTLCHDRACKYHGNRFQQAFWNPCINKHPFVSTYCPFLN